MNLWWSGLSVLQQVMFVIGTVSAVFILLKSVTGAIGKNQGIAGAEITPAEKRLNDFALYVLLAFCAGFCWLVFGFEYLWELWWLSLIIGFAGGVVCGFAAGIILKSVYAKYADQRGAVNEAVSGEEPMDETRPIGKDIDKTQDGKL